jgi:DNA-binding SARP family transcriptional activator/DNA-binding XRE family transcriptional regulator
VTNLDHESHDGFASGRAADLIREFRYRAGLTQREVAALAGISIGGLCDLEQGRVLRPRPDTLRRLASALGLSAFEKAQLIRVRLHPVRTEIFQVRVLGPLSVMLDSECVELRSMRQRKLLGLLAISAGVPVSRHTLIEELWGSKPPVTAENLLQTYVHRLRKRIARGGAECANVLSTRQGGYQLDVNDHQLDLLAFHRLVEDARHERKNGRDESALTIYQRAVSLWRGAPLDDLPDLRHQPLVTELETQRHTVIGEYADTAFALGRHVQLIGLLQREVSADPLNEAAHERLMIALAYAGRQASALEVFRIMRARLADELGVEPQADLRAVHEAILRGHLRRPAPTVTAEHAANPRNAETAGCPQCS